MVDNERRVGIKSGTKIYKTKDNRARRLTMSFINHDDLILKVDSQGFSGRFLQ